MDDHAYFFGLEGPLEAIPAAGQMRAANLRGFADYVRSRGASPRRILTQHGLDPRLLADPDGHIACQAVATLFEHCSALFDDPLFGLHLGATQDADVFGAVTAVCRAAPDMRAVMTCLVNYIPVSHSPEAVLYLVEDNGIANLRCAVRAAIGSNDQANYQATMLILKLLDTVSSGTFRLSGLQLAVDARPQDLVEIEALVGCPVRAGGERNIIRFPASLLDRPVATADRLIYRLLGGYLARLRLINRADIGERVRSYVRGALPSGQCSVERCAEKLGLSVRTLQARLSLRALRFNALVEEQRQQLATIYLRQTPMPISEVVERLGYADQTSFGRAFRRWTGSTPANFRKDNSYA